MRSALEKLIPHPGRDEQKIPLSAGVHEQTVINNTRESIAQSVSLSTGVPLKPADVTPPSEQHPEGLEELGEKPPADQPLKDVLTLVVGKNEGESRSGTMLAEAVRRLRRQGKDVKLAA